MFEILELKYNKEELQTYINKKHHTFLWFNEWLMIFKFKQVTSRQLVAKKEADKFFEQFQDIKNPVIDNTLMSKLADELWIQWNNEKETLAKFINFWTEWKTEWKAKWEKERTKRGTFEIVNRMRVFLGNKPTLNNYKKPWIRKI